MPDKEFLIPIDRAITDFRHHLDAHDRTILSACFGDGKSFFLSHFMEDEDVAENYTFLTIFPVNYQVVENRDIFELIKRDILLQMLLKGIIETDIEISDAEALALYMQCKPLSFIESFIPLLAELPLSDDVTKSVACTIAFKNAFKTIKQKIDNIKKQSDDNRIEQFLNEVEQNPIVGQDVISGIIQKGIKQYKNQYPNKRVVLVIEDMDRIDPAHLFRILNVFSAHIDFGYRMGIRPPTDTLSGNKFGLDKVIFVLDYNNLKNIYKHFYGAETSFDGYIQKFCSSNYFCYSLHEEQNKYLQQLISKETGIGSNVIELIIHPNDFTVKSLRSIVSAIKDSESFLIDPPTVKSRDGQMVPLHTGILRLIAICRKLGVRDSDIIDRFKNAIVTRNSSNSGIFEYLSPYLNLVKFENPLGNLRYANSTDMANTVRVDYINEDGRASCTFNIYLNTDKNAEQSLISLIRNVLNMVAK